jgi:hypothetical protein
VENWYDTATLLHTDLRTSNLTSLDTTTLNLFNSTQEQSIKVSGFFRAKKTGTYRFFTYSNDKNILEIDGDDIIVNNDLKQNTFANKSLIAGRYYSFNLYYGSRVFNYPPVPLVTNGGELTGQLYGNGVYTVTSSSNTSGRTAFDLFDGAGSWRPQNTDRVGAWVQLELPNAIVLGAFQVNTFTGGGAGVPRKFKIEGSNDNFATSVLLNETDWDVDQGSKTIEIDPPVNQAFKYFRLTNLEVGYGTSFIQYNYPLMFYEKANISTGYLEPNDNGTNTGSTDPNDFIKNATGLTTYYDINPQTQPVLITSNFPLVMEDDTLQGRFRVSPLALYINRPNFLTSKYDIFYIASDELFNNFNGTYKNYIQLHEKPIADDNERKRFTQFSSDMSFECELNGKIEIRIRRGDFEPVTFRYFMVILDVERLDEE